MKFIELAKKRYSCRSFMAKSVEREKLEIILEAGRVAPTGCNYQPQRVIVVETPEGLEKLARCTRFYKAPLAIIVCCDTEKTWVRPYDGKKLTDIDVSIVTDHMMLQATELGLGSLWICNFKPDAIRAEFDIPENIEIVNILVIGYEADEPLSPDRHSELRFPQDAFVSYERFGSQAR